MKGLLEITKLDIRNNYLISTFEDKMHWKIDMKESISMQVFFLAINFFFQENIWFGLTICFLSRKDAKVLPLTDVNYKLRAFLASYFNTLIETREVQTRFDHRSSNLLEYKFADYNSTHTG